MQSLMMLPACTAAPLTTWQKKAMIEHIPTEWLRVPLLLFGWSGHLFHPLFAAHAVDRMELEAHVCTTYQFAGK